MRFIGFIVGDEEIVCPKCAKQYFGKENVQGLLDSESVEANCYDCEAEIK